MASTNFKLFDENKSNMMADADYLQNTQRLNGVQSGVASSQLQNKSLYQTTLMAYAIAQMMVANNIDANDTAAVSTFVSNLSKAVMQKTADKATVADYNTKNNTKWFSPAMLRTILETFYLQLAGGTMSGSLYLKDDPSTDLEAATKRYVDSSIDDNVAIGTYNGTATTTSVTTQKITLKKQPKFVIVTTSNGKVNNDDTANYMTIRGNILYTTASDSATTGIMLRIDSDGFTVGGAYGYQGGLGNGINVSGIRYIYLAIF
nr:MAG TPA: hypothetical protein [Caudoviricetes sp.]